MCLGRIAVVQELFEQSGLPMAGVDVEGRRQDVCLLYVPSASPGDHVIVELGFAVDLLDPAAASEALRLRAGDQQAATVALPVRPEP